MFEIPEIITLARQMNATLPGKVVEHGSLGNSPHKFVWYNHSPPEFAALTSSKQVGRACPRGRWLLVDLEPGYRLVLGECGGKLLYHAPGEARPARHHLLIVFGDGSALSAMTTMWGAMELYPAGEEMERQYLRDMRPTPVDPGFTPAYFNDLLAECRAIGRRSVKSLLTQDQLIPGLGNAIAQDILFRAGLHPRRELSELDASQCLALYHAILSTLADATAKGGRAEETDLFGHPGGYVRLMDSRTAGKPCPACGQAIEKIQYLGGACYFCPHCQQ